MRPTLLTSCYTWELPRGCWKRSRDKGWYNMRLLDLFSGIGGFSLAVQWVWGDDLEIVSFVEIDPYCQKVLRKHWPNVPIHSDIKSFDSNKYGTVDLITGGFPCQPFSQAGKQRGKEDDRYLWPEMFRVIKESRPRWIVGENVSNIVTMELNEMLSDLESEGYEVCPIVVPACAVEAPHRRDRMWIIANSFSDGAGRIAPLSFQEGSFLWKSYGIYDSRTWLKTNGGIDRENDGIPRELDRIKSLGNAIVPQVAEQIFRAIKEIEE